MGRIACLALSAQLLASTGCLTWAATTPREERTWSEFGKWGAGEVALGAIPGLAGAIAADPNNFVLVPQAIGGVFVIDAAIALVVLTLDSIETDD